MCVSDAAAVISYNIPRAIAAAIGAKLSISGLLFERGYFSTHAQATELALLSGCGQESKHLQ